MTDNRWAPPRREPVRRDRRDPSVEDGEARADRDFDDGYLSEDNGYPAESDGYAAGHGHPADYDQYPDDPSGYPAGQSSPNDPYYAGDFRDEDETDETVWDDSPKRSHDDRRRRFAQEQFIDEDDADDPHGPWQAADDDRPSGRRAGLIVGGAAAVLATVGLSIWWGSAGSPVGGLPEQAPLISALPGSYKEKPVDAGGLEVPHQDRQILQTLGGRHTPDRVESLLPGPEEPLPIPGMDEWTAGEDAAFAADRNDLPLIPEAESVESREAATVPSGDGAGDQSTGAGARPENATAEDVDESTVGFDGREDQIAALIERMGILDDDLPPAQPSTAPTDNGPIPPQPQPQQETPPVSAAPSGDDRLADGARGFGPVADGGFRVQLGSVDSATAARNEWTRLSSRHSDLLGGLTMDVQEADIAGRAWFRVQAGPLSREVAERVCRELETRNAGCIVVGR